MIDEKLGMFNVTVWMIACLFLIPTINTNYLIANEIRAIKKKYEEINENK